MSTTNKTQTENRDHVEEVIEKLDKEGLEDLQQVLSENQEATDLLAKTLTVGNSAELTEKEKESIGNIQNSLMSIITNGAKKFEEETGRPMTYAEMRAAYG
jgi:hypothetical protein